MEKRHLFQIQLFIKYFLLKFGFVDMTFLFKFIFKYLKQFF